MKGETLYRRKKYRGMAEKEYLESEKQEVC